MAQVRIEHVYKRFGAVTAVDNFDVVVEDGEFVSILGPSGCGKTTTLRMIAGFERATEGEIYIGDKCVSSSIKGTFAPPEKRDIGMVFQSYAVWPHMTVAENVGYPLKIQKVAKEERAKRVQEMLELVHLGEYGERYPHQLSGGQQQRVALARALVADPSVMLLDEPLSNLDANLREEMRFEIKGLQEKFGITVLYVTHDQEVALALSDRIAIMDTNGAIRQIGTPYEIFEQPADLFVFKFMGIANFLHVTEKAGKFCVGEGDQVIPWDAPTGNAASWVAGFRPSDVTISREANGLKGKIRRANFLGATMDYMVEIDGETLRTELETHHAINNNLMFEEGEECYITFKALHWFDAKQLEEVAE